MPLHFLIVLFHLSCILQSHRTEKSQLNDPYHNFVIIPNIQLIKSLIYAMLQVVIQKLLHRFDHLIQSDRLILIHRQRLQ